MKYLLTGANGYIGRHVTRQLLALKDAEVITVARSKDSVDERARHLCANVLDDTIDIFNLAGQPDVCIHMAWSDAFVHNSDYHMENLSGHYRFLCRLGESGIKRIAVIGTMHEVGYHEGAIDEDTPCNPLSMYGIAKDTLRRSLFLRFINDDEIKLQWLRAYYICGDDIRSNSIFAKLLLAERNNQAEFPFTTGKNKHDFIDVGELAAQIAAVASQGRINGIINCCSGRPISLSEKIEGFIKENKLKIKLKYGAYPERAYDSPVVYGDITKISGIMNVSKTHC